jgi:uncharacterized protein (TIGR02996 family)
MPVNLEEAFRADIDGRPADDAPRLIYADWLEDTGRPAAVARAEFIRLQCRLARLPAGDAGRPGLEARARALLARCERDWLGPLYSPVLHWQFRRGFVEALAHSGLFRACQGFLAPDGKPTVGWLRFYADGTVLAFGTGPETPAQVAHWFHKQHPYVARGRYTLRAGRRGVGVRFDTSGDAGTVSYAGTLHGLSLALDVCSRINGYRGRETYYWVEAPGCDSLEFEG